MKTEEMLENIFNKVKLNNYFKTEISELLNKVNIQIEGVINTNDIEYIHNLRIISRRIFAALSIINIFLSNKYVEKYKSFFNKITKSYGIIRDYDVKISHLEKFRDKLIKDEYNPHVNLLIEILNQKRSVIKSGIKSSLSELNFSNFIDNMQLKMEKVYSDLKKLNGKIIAKKCMNDLTKKINLLMSYHSVIINIKNTKEIHKTRKAIRHLRYTLEQYKNLFKINIDDYIKAAKTIQSILGEFNDYTVLINTIKKISKELQDKNMHEFINFLIKNIRMKQKELHKNFLTLWYQYKSDNIWTKLQDIFTFYF